MATGTAELRKFIAEFEKLPGDIRREIRPRLRRTGESAVADVRLRASWSTRIPAATKLRTSLAQRTAGIAIEVDRHKAPHARPYEHGGRPGTFRHPLFGNRKHWYVQPARPFLVPGARPHFERVDREIFDAVDEAAREAGFR